MSSQFLLVWILVGLLVLAHLAETLQAATYEEVVGRACGAAVKAVVDGCIVIYTFGTCVAFLVVIGDQLQDCKCLSGVRRYRYIFVSVDSSVIGRT